MAQVAALVLEEPRRLVERAFDVPEIDASSALLRVEACGLCGTDHEQYTGALPAPGAFVPGHEAVGVIETIGEQASRAWGIEEGDRVAVEPLRSCGACARCASSGRLRCERYSLGDAYGFVAAGRPPGLWGGYAQMQYLGPGTVLHRVPDTLDPVVATLFNPIGAGVRWAVTVPATKPGDTVAILGPGVRGLACAAAVKEAGASFVCVTGRGERDAPRLDLARSFGADLVVDVAERDAASAFGSAAGHLADVVVDVTAKAPEAFGQAVSLARPGGRVVLAGTRGVEGTPGLYPDLIVYKELTIMGVLGVEGASYATALDLLASGRYPFADLPRRIEPLSGAAALLATMAGEGDGPPPVHGVIKP